MIMRLSKNNWLSTTGLLLVLPTAFFILISVLKYAFGVDGPFDAMQPTLERWGIRHFGWNINLLIIFGPLTALLLTVFQVLKINWRSAKDQFIFQITIRKYWFPLFVAGFSVSIMAILFIYFLGENYVQH